MRTLRNLFTALFLLCLAEMATAQDVIVKKDQSTIMSKVLEITSMEIKYKKWNNQDGPTYSIERSEVLSINYENGEVEQFSETTDHPQTVIAPQYQQPNNQLICDGADLYLNNRLLSNDEIRRLLDSQSYQQYLKGRRQMQSGSRLMVGGLTLGLTCGLVGILLNHLLYQDNSVPGRVVLTTVWVCGGLGTGMFFTGTPINICGNHKIKKVVKTYNMNHGSNYSLNISPSLMRCETPQSQGNCGMGLTVSMNF